MASFLDHRHSESLILGIVTRAEFGRGVCFNVNHNPMYAIRASQLKPALRQCLAGIVSFDPAIKERNDESAATF